MTSHRGARRARLAVALAVPVAVLAALVQPPVAQAAPLRSGRIVSGVFTTSYAWGCSGHAECLAWLESGCDPALAGRDPAWLVSIVDVADLADGTTPRMLEVRRGGPESLVIGGAAVQFWRADCTELRGARWHTQDCHWSECTRRDHYTLLGRSGAHRIKRTMTVPAAAAWMTVSANDNLDLVWILR